MHKLRTEGGVMKLRVVEMRPRALPKVDVVRELRRLADQMERNEFHGQACYCVVGALIERSDGKIGVVTDCFGEGTAMSGVYLAEKIKARVMA